MAHGIHFINAYTTKYFVLTLKMLLFCIEHVNIFTLNLAFGWESVVLCSRLTVQAVFQCFVQVYLAFQKINIILS